MLANETPSVLVGGQFYASAALVGALVYVLLVEWGASRIFVLWIPIVVIFGIRASSIFYGWGVPTFDVPGPGDVTDDPNEGSRDLP